MEILDKFGQEIEPGSYIVYAGSPRIGERLRIAKVILSRKVSDIKTGHKMRFDIVVWSVYGDRESPRLFTDCSRLSLPENIIVLRGDQVPVDIKEMLDAKVEEVLKAKQAKKE